MTKRLRYRAPLLAWLFAFKTAITALRATTSGKPVVWLSLSGGGAGSASDLRGVSVAPELDRLGWYSVVLHPRLSLLARRLLLRLFRPAVVVLQQTRHPLNRPDIYAPVPCVLDVDDADIINTDETARIGDIAANCQGVVAGSRHLAELFSPFNPARRVIWTGTYVQNPPEHALPNGQRGAVLAWAPSDAFGYPSELAFVQRMAGQLQRADLTLRIYGIKPARQPEMAALWQGQLPSNVRLQLMQPMPYLDFVASLAEVAVGLQPVCEEHTYSLGKSFGKALAYLAADVAVVASHNIDHPLFFKDGVNSRMLGNNPEAWATACDELLGHANLRQALVKQARQDFLARLTTTRSAELLSELLHRTRQGQRWPQGLAASTTALAHP